MQTSVWALRGIVQDMTIGGTSIDVALTRTIERHVPLAERHEASEALLSLLRAEARGEDEDAERLTLSFPDRTQLELFNREG